MSRKKDYFTSVGEMKWRGEDISAVIILCVSSPLQAWERRTHKPPRHTQNKPLHLQMHSVSKVSQVSLPPAIFLVTQSQKSLCTKDSSSSEGLLQVTSLRFLPPTTHTHTHKQRNQEMNYRIHTGPSVLAFLTQKTIFKYLWMWPSNIDVGTIWLLLQT